MRHGREIYLVEPRLPDGSLNAKKVGEKGDLTGDYTEDQLFKLFFADNPGKDSASWYELHQWLHASGGYKCREKTW